MQNSELHSQSCTNYGNEQCFEYMLLLVLSARYSRRVAVVFLGDNHFDMNCLISDSYMS